ncbi:hypothetical protein F5B20DRAFT_550415 [Whalleya microplaca]|nr:hypothetical protein F5B20DRAFT_550415 [Whalleya microplaca]
MADNESSLSHLVLLRRRQISEQGTNILNAFARGMQPATPETTAEAARQLDDCCPPLERKEEVHNYLWTVWEIMLDTARSPDVSDEIQERLVSILESLRLYAKGDLDVWGSKCRVWRDLPLLPMCMESYFNDPSSETGEFTPESAQIWRKLNTFAARCLASGTIGTYYQAMYALRLALEEELSAVLKVYITECRIQVACAWMAYGAKPLLWWAKENIGMMDVIEADTANYVERGALYHGPATMCLRRWGFWLDRFEELGKEESGMSEGCRKAAVEAALIMKTVEKGTAHTLTA